MGRYNDLTGQRFGKLVVIEKAERPEMVSHRDIYWLCQCDCGKNHIIRSSHLQSGNTKSCGCSRKPGRGKGNAMIGPNNPQYRHGISGHRLYIAWSNMKQRCNNPNAHEYNAYGGRGITVCEEWLHDVKAFYDWAMSHGYRDDLTLDRIDVNGNYCPENCRWITQKQQYANMRPR